MPAVSHHLQSCLPSQYYISARVSGESSQSCRSSAAASHLKVLAALPSKLAQLVPLAVMPTSCSIYEYTDSSDMQIKLQIRVGAAASQDEPFLLTVPSKDVLSPDRAMQSSARKFSPLQFRSDFINRDHSAVSHGKALLKLDIS